MKRKQREIIQSEDLYVGIDLHKRTWHITIPTLIRENIESQINVRFDRAHF